MNTEIDLVLCLQEYRGSEQGMHTSRQPIEDWVLMNDFYSNAKELRRCGVEWVELYILDENMDEPMVLLKRWEAAP